MRGCCEEEPVIRNLEFEIWNSYQRADGATAELFDGGAVKARRSSGRGESDCRDPDGNH
jgi:hypothetical protein